MAPEAIEDGTNYLGLEHIKPGGTITSRQVVQQGDLASQKFRFDDGHILYGKLRPYLAKIIIPSFSGVCSTDILPIRPGPNVDQRFLLHFLRQPNQVEQVSTLATGANLPRINPKVLEGVQIPLPPIKEQRRIAAVLDAADALRAKRRQAIAKLGTLAQAIFIDMFGDPLDAASRWDSTPLDDLLERIDSGRSPVCLDRPARSGEWGVLKAGAVTYCTFDATQSKALPAYETPDPKNEVKSGDVLFSRKNTRDLVAACALVRDTPPRLLLSDLIFRLVISDRDRLDPAFLQAQLVHPRMRKHIQRLAGGSSGSMPNISKSKLLGVELRVPPADHQKTFARRVAAAQRSADALEASAARLDSLFSSLQQRAFRGEL